MVAYWSGATNWCKAKPTVKNRAKNSKLSSVHPRFAATSVFHCGPLSERYQGSDETTSVLAIDHTLLVTTVLWSVADTGRNYSTLDDDCCTPVCAHRGRGKA